MERWDLRVGVGESLLKLALRLDTSVFHVLEVLGHVLHLVLEVSQIVVVSSLSLNHLFAVLKTLQLLNYNYKNSDYIIIPDQPTNKHAIRQPSSCRNDVPRSLSD